MICFGNFRLCLHQMQILLVLMINFYANYELKCIFHTYLLLHFGRRAKITRQNGKPERLGKKGT